jgi:hypothetical protein
MKKEWLGAVGGLLASAGLCLAQGLKLPPQSLDVVPNGTSVAAVKDDAPPAALKDGPPKATAVLPPLANAPFAVGDRPPPAFQDTPDSCERFWFNADCLLWWVKKGPSVPLVTTGPAGPNAGALGQPGTVVLFGDNGLRYDTFSGMRFDAGWWFDSCQHLGLEVGGFALERRAAQFNAMGDPFGQPFIARPYVNAVTGQNSAYNVSQNFTDPALGAEQTGGIRINSTSRLSGWDINLVSNVYHTGCFSVQLIGGFRNLILNENLPINETILPIVSNANVHFLGTTVEIPNGVGIYDDFRGDNWFYGPQLGGRIDYQRGKLGVDLVTKVAVGVTQELVSVAGASTLLSPDVMNYQAPGGILAQTTNMGRHLHDNFAVVPEVGLNLSYCLAPGIKAHVGYTFLYWSDVARPGGSIDPNINPGLVPTDPRFGTVGGPSRPTFFLHQDDFWAQGLDFGLEFRF